MRVLAPLLCLLAGCSLSVDYTGTYFPCGENDSCPEDFICKQNVCIPTEPAPPTCSSAVATGDQHSCMVRDTDGTVWCWGRNNDGQLGNATTTDSTIPVQVEGITGATTVVTGARYSCAVVGGAVSCWGANDQGQLGDGSQTGSRTPVAVSNLSDVRALALGEQHTCAITGSGAVSCWGFNDDGQLGDGTTTSRRVPGPVPGISGATSIAASDDSTCVIDGGTLKCWGFNGEGLFMLGTTANSVPDPTASTLIDNLASVAIGGGHLCVVTAAGEVHCAGTNDQGQLGNGTTVASTVPVQAPIPATVVSVSLGFNHSCAVDDQGGAWCWGDDDGKLALGNVFDFVAAPVLTVFEDVDSISAGGDHTCARSRAGAISCAGFNGMGQLGNGSRITQPQPQPVPGLTGIEAIACGGDFACALDGSGNVKCWGEGDDGELGDGAFHERAVPGAALVSDVTQLVAGGDHACALLADGSVSCWGRGTSGQLGDGTQSSRGTPLPVSGLIGATQLALGDNHSCALTGTSVLCWGANGSGQLGAVSNPSPLPLDVPGLVDGPFLMVSAGSSHSCALDSLGEVQCWGSNGSGQLGIAVGSGMGGTSTPSKVVLRSDSTTRLSGVEEIFSRGADTFARVGGQIFGWGNGCDARLGSNNATCTITPAAVPVVDISTADKLAGGYTASCARKTDGTLSCWGPNYFGQLGDGTYASSNPVPLPGLSVIDVSAGREHVCAVRTDASVVCWGAAHSGQLGDGVIDNRGPNFVRFSCE